MKHRVIKAAHARRGQKQCQLAEGPDRCQSLVSSVGTGCPIPQRERQCEIETLLVLDPSPMPRSEKLMSTSARNLRTVLADQQEPEVKNES
jgi:hypothetical protein